MAEQPPPPTQEYGTPGAEPPKGMSVAALVLGIIGVIVCIPYFVPQICAILAIILGYIAKKKVAEGTAGGGGMAKAGFILGIIGVALTIVLVIVGLILGAAILGMAGKAASDEGGLQGVFDDLREDVEQEMDRQRTSPSTPVPAEPDESSLLDPRLVPNSDWLA